MSSYDSIFGSAIGSSHRERGEDKQDSVSILTDKNGNTTFCLSDGAGSSKLSQHSSKICADFIASSLLELPKEIDKRGVGAWINDYIVQCVLDLRTHLFREFQTYDLREYHCTLVAGILFQGNCLVAHLGDGAIIAGTCNINGDTFLLNEKLVVSEPENGEYKNETYFLTEQHWLSHLRIKFIPNVDWLIAGTDGGIDLLSEGDRLKDHHVFELLLTLNSFSRKEKQELLQLQLESEVADKITNDDKSLVIIISRKLSASKNLSWEEEGDSFKSLYPPSLKDLKADQTKDIDQTQSEDSNKKKPSDGFDFKQFYLQFVDFVKKRPVVTSLSSVTIFLIAYGFIAWQLSLTSAEIAQPKIITPDIDKGLPKSEKPITSEKVKSPIGNSPVILEEPQDNQSVIEGVDSELTTIVDQSIIKDEVDTKPLAKWEDEPLSSVKQTGTDDAITNQHQENFNNYELGTGIKGTPNSSGGSVQPTEEGQIKNDAPVEENVIIKNSETSSSMEIQGGSNKKSSSNSD